MASTKKLQKAATAALDSALDAVVDARKGVKALAKADGAKKAKKARGSAEDALDTAAKKIKDAEKATKKAVKSATKEAPAASPETPATPAPKPTKSHEQVEAEVAQKSVVPTTSAPKGPGAAYTPPLPHADETTVTAHDGSEAHVDLHAQTLVSLRQLATDKGVTGVSRLTKAQLIERLQA
ncbi:hypothetical protein ES689_10700 [Frigoribacterium sp. ACAM 257]|uniref:Rho termination factor N-terminal domain-containing protein n=1 Tax=Frigoribacterium sp. ACAM 257 TaxID=2508998 RepID=UPI0011B959F9|nr:Rho termination factor N-terminal domain-containing protein [Frigoribacterium sp. ACAM 257]TWX37142.1 hypothetical protein ES689_10700 [Frigoribacterium sp. ACAM 257]